MRLSGTADPMSQLRFPCAGISAEVRDRESRKTSRLAGRARRRMRLPILLRFFLACPAAVLSRFEIGLGVDQTNSSPPPVQGSNLIVGAIVSMGPPYRASARVSVSAPVSARVFVCCGWRDLRVCQPVCLRMCLLDQMEGDDGAAIVCG